jgi:ketosteroid isomerase-like protein
MKKTLRFILLAAASTFFAACGGPAASTGANNANTNTTKPVAAAPTADALMALDKQANEAYVKGDSKFFEGMLSDKFVILTGGGQRMDKAATVKMIAGVKCDIKSMDLTEPAMSMIDADTYALSYKATWDGTCNGPDGKPMKVPSPVRSASIWVRSGDKWQAVFHGENLIVDPKNPVAPAAPPKKPKRVEPKKDLKTAANSNTAANIAAPAWATPDANTDALVKVELALWEAWKEHDAKKLDALMAKDVSFVNIFGTYLATRADALKDWTGASCEVKSVSVTDGFASALSPTVEMLTRKGTADGTCGGQEIGGTAIWGVSIYVKEGDAWKFAFGMNLSAM